MFLFSDPPSTLIYTLSLHDALPISEMILAETAIDLSLYKENQMKRRLTTLMHSRGYEHFHDYYAALAREDRKSTRLNSSHVAISYAVFCLKKKNVFTAIVHDTLDMY